MLKRLAVLMVLLCGSTPAWADARSDCEKDSSTPDQRITACSAVIRGDAKAAWAYLMRGKAYRALDELDRAIAKDNEG